MKRHLATHLNSTLLPPGTTTNQHHNNPQQQQQQPQQQTLVSHHLSHLPHPQHCFQCSINLVNKFHSVFLCISLLSCIAGGLDCQSPLQQSQASHSASHVEHFLPIDFPWKNSSDLTFWDGDNP